jgi:hypothetical protein
VAPEHFDGPSTFSTESTCDAGDQYIGLDRFGRVADQRWMVSSTGTTNDRYQYGFDRDGNVLYRSNLSNHSMDELYHANGSSNGYDSLGQMTAFLHGTLSDTNSDGVPDTVASNSRSQTWSFDAVGNWSSVTTNGTAQTRTANQQNQITSITGMTTPAYDADGHMTTDQAGTGGWMRSPWFYRPATRFDIACSPFKWADQRASRSL